MLFRISLLQNITISTVLAGSFFVSQTALASDKAVKIGVVSTLEGDFASFGVESMRGVKLAFAKWNGTAGGQPISYVEKASDGTNGSAVQAARELIEKNGVEIIVGPMSSKEGLEFKELAKEFPAVTFFNGASSAPGVTQNEPAVNLFRFNTDAVQWMSGLGSYVYNEKAYKKVVAISEDYDFARSQTWGFLNEFCDNGGKVVQSHWVKPKAVDYREIIDSFPKDYDAIFLPHGGDDALKFLIQYEEAGGKKPLIGGSITIDKIFYSTRGSRKKYLQGIPAAGPVTASYDGEAWKEFKADYLEMFPKGYNSPSLFSHAYYVNTHAALSGLEKINGDLSDGHKKYREALISLELETPTGIVKLNDNRQAVADIFISEVQKGQRKLYKKYIKTVSAAKQVISTDDDEFAKTGMPGKELPKSCKTTG